MPFDSDGDTGDASGGDIGFSLEDEPPIRDENEKTIDIYSVFHTCSIPAKSLKNISKYVPFAGAMCGYSLRSEKCLSSPHPFRYLGTKEGATIRPPFVVFKMEVLFEVSGLKTKCGRRDPLECRRKEGKKRESVGELSSAEDNEKEKKQKKKQKKRR